jgi:hypothetical protein
LFLALLSFLSIFSFFILPYQIWIVALPIGITLMVAIVFFIILYRRSGMVPLEEIGFWYVGIVSLYSIYPLVIFVKKFTFNDWRIVYIYQPNPEQVARLGWIHVAYIVVFALFYLIGRKRRASSFCQRKSLGKFSVSVAVVLFLSIEIFLYLLGRIYPLSVSSYYEKFLVFRKLPMLLQQVVTKLNGIQFVLIVLLLSFLFAAYGRWRWLIWGWLSLEVIVKFKQQLGVGSDRTWLMLIFVAVITLYHIRVKPISLRVFLLTGTAALAFFLILGFIRQNIGSDGGSNPGIFNKNTEFESIFANAYDIRERIKTGNIPKASLSFYLADFTALVPQQFFHQTFKY